MARHIHRITTPTIDERQESLLGRARKLRRKGELKKATVVLREACLLNEHSAWLWSLYGSLLAEHGRADEARQALRHALWLRRGAGDLARVRTTQLLIDRIGTSKAA